jgi:2-iminobutanoate/2-iminopropanoate deaminase
MPKQIIGVIRGVPISTGVKAGNYIFLSGQIGLVDERGNELKGIEAQTRQALENMKGILREAGASLSDVVKVTIFLVNVDDFAKMNEVYKSYFTEDYPARSTVVVAALARPEMIVEIECIAYCPD